LSLAIYKQNILFLVPVLGLVVLGIVLTNYAVLYYLLLLAIPFSMEVDLPGGFGTDLFSEPLIILLAACYLGSWLLGKNPDKQLMQHPLIKLLLLFFTWSVITSLLSADHLRSGKYLVAKIWYLLVFVFLAGDLIRNPTTWRRFLYLFIGALGIVVTITLIRHAAVGFTFAAANKIVAPFLRNHVMYGVLSASALPYAVYLTLQQKNTHRRAVIGIISFLLLAGVLASYTRASWLSLPLAVLYGFIIRFRLTRYLLAFILLTCVAGVIYLSSNYRYMQYAPDYEKTIFNKDDIRKHLQATYTLRDVSGMERVYRWIAAARMIADRPFTGSGPHTFYPEYLKYTVSRFTTYVSDNPEQSTVHNYFLLQFAENGYPGGILFLIFMGYALLLPEKIYHRTTQPEHRKTVLAVGLCLFIIAVHLFLNELLETDKIGSLFYLSLVALIRLDYWTTNSRKNENRS
ncbi:MAG: O-antigen ligase family protein, partial [Bacteroidota bacterium]|nr:O-antigen ligase family protein [Bacteroidota bacterium]